MTRIRFRIATILIIILFLGAGCAALREASDLWQRGVFSLAVTALFASVLLAIHRAGTRRSFWIGFALCGWGYLALSLVPPIESRLITSWALAYLDSKIPGRSQNTSFVFPVFNSGAWNSPNATSATATWAPAQNWNTSSNQFVITGATTYAAPSAGTFLWATAGGDSDSFMKIGHALLALIAAWLGGWLALWCRKTTRHEPAA
jgi:hypothetical protein